ncbi:hypothetical protein Tco_0948022 [Tanacetum coccineum]
MLTDLPTAPELPAVSPFLCSDDSEFELADELPEIHLSPRHFSVMVSRWRAKVISRPSLPSGSSSPNTTISSIEIPFAPIPPAPSIEIATAPPACDTLTLVIIASPAVRSHIRMTVRKSTLGLRPVMTPARSAALRKAHLAILSPETSSSNLLGRGVGLQLRPFHLQFMLHEPYHRVEMTSYHLTRGIEADIEAETTAAATIAAATIDGLGTKMGFEPGLAVVESASEPEEAEANDEADAEIQAEGTIEIGVDVTTGIGISYDLPMPDTIERLEQLKESVQGMYGHMLEIPLQKIEVIKAGQTDQQARNLIADDERSSLL